ncbi:LysR family transcriptional regulator [Thioclava sp. SK-1]|uniref:LysR family transcriptional regulator n=1 Tax=Thioclava sp. SK-1 TaxID=1889770 RepID=UPI0008250EDD|nr:LysR family transcriptional regulator [Thioclava sp. SK-1]OCX56637.1 LysR family transcriptional regulator [Thioclava sp. SK-1]
MSRRAFNDLYVFTVVAEHLSFTRAAAQLGLSQSTLSQIIRNLEKDLGVRLFNRSTRSVSTTDAGAELMERIGPQFDEVLAALRHLDAVRETPSGILRINATEHAAISVLRPKVGKFLQAYPDIQIEITVEGSMVDVIAQGYDAGVRLGSEVAKDMIAARISPDVPIACVAAPSYIVAHSMPDHPTDLTEHRCIAMRLPTHGQIFAWEFVKDGEEIRVRVDGPAIYNNLFLRVASVLDGIGIGYVPLDLVEEHIASGRLQPVLQDWWPVWEGYHLYYPNRRQSTPAFRLFLNAIRHR